MLVADHLFKMLILDVVDRTQAELIGWFPFRLWNIADVTMMIIMQSSSMLTFTCNKQVWAEPSWQLH